MLTEEMIKRTKKFNHPESGTPDCGYEHIKPCKLTVDTEDYNRVFLIVVLLSTCKVST
jgi:hypothetical protein